MRKIFFFILLFSVSILKAQTDTSNRDIHVDGNIGITNNGISIIPTFSLQEAAFNTTFSISKGGRFSIDPDFRLTFDFRKGGGLVWFRYKLMNSKKFQMTLGAHPAFNLSLETKMENGLPVSITQWRRFVATEIAPTYAISDHMKLGLYYLHGNGLQKDGPISTHFVNLSTSFVDLSLGGNYLLTIMPQVYYLQVDNEDGYYSTGSLIFANKKSPFAIMSTYNKEIRTNITGSKNFDWNITLMYSFSKLYAQRK